MIISVLIFGVELHSVFQDMREHPDWHRDADFVFWFGMLCRMVFYNIVFLPFSILGVAVRDRQKKRRHETRVA